jgi:DNA primase|tara:strand:+ start:4185 stop:4862 length:678 start_codon:yes stop_codon:yes gene_type:complete
LGQQTLHSDEGKEAIDYLVKDRGLSIGVIKKFQVGYCPQRVDHELRGRIVTPIHDPYGSLVALSSRQLKKKFFFHESYDKGFYLYGLHIAKPYIIKYGRVVIVEGEFDVMYLHSHGVPMAVGMCGSALNLFQLSVLARYCENIYIVFDGDKKCNQSIKRVLNMYHANHMWTELRNSEEREGVKLYPVKLPMGYDPDDYIKKFGNKKFIALLKGTDYSVRRKRSNV